jgi:hypothetical protein
MANAITGLPPRPVVSYGDTLAIPPPNAKKSSTKTKQHARKTLKGMEIGEPDNEFGINWVKLAESFSPKSGAGVEIADPGKW